MVVFNSITCSLNGPGLYIWDGGKWNIVVSTMDVSMEDYSSVTDADEITYTAAYFGSACWWMTQNLRTTANLTLSNNPGSTSGKYYYYPNNNVNLFNTHPEYGLLYRWETASDGPVDGGVYQGICPAGWHIPNYEEWEDLMEVIGNSNDEYSAPTAPGDFAFVNKMKSQTKVAGDGIEDTDGTSHAWNMNGFDALLVGNNDDYGNDYGEVAYFWTSTIMYSQHMHAHISRDITGFSGDEAGGGALKYTVNKNDMYSIRCKKD
jgi:uncharacterized protein (TIGR02145 family)